MGLITEVILLAAVGGGVYLYETGQLEDFLTPNNPLKGLKKIGQWFENLENIGVGVPVELEPCPDGWSNDGLICRKPLGWNDHCVYWGLGNWSGCATGGDLVGRLNHGGVCPADHPEKIDGLCYRKCKPGWQHTEGMPYTCRDPNANFGDSLLSAVKSSIPFSGLLGL
jgi:hypothetical protein